MAPRLVAARPREAVLAFLARAAGDEAIRHVRLRSPVTRIEFDGGGPGPLGEDVTGSSRDHVHSDVSPTAVTTARR